MSRALRIAVAASGLGHVTRGIESWAADLGWALRQRGVPVTLCKGGGRADLEFERLVPCWQRGAARTAQLLRRLPRASWRVGLGSSYAVEQTTFAWSLLGQLRRERIDLLHVQDPLVALICQRARRLGWIRARTILAHGTEEPLEFQRRITYLQHLAPGHLEESRAAGVWKPTWTAIPNFIDTEVFCPGASGMRTELGIPANAAMILAVAAVKRQHKRIDHLVEEFARYLQRRPGTPAYLVVAGGRADDTDEVMAAARQALGDRVRFLIGFPRNRMPELYRSATLFVLTSLKEMMPIALLEAAASGLPCLVHRQAVLEWMAGRGGEAIDMATPGDLARALEQLLSQPQRRQQLGSLARQHCLEHFSRDRVVNQILAYYCFVHTHDRAAWVRRSR